MGSVPSLTEARAAAGRALRGRHRAHSVGLGGAHLKATVGAAAGAQAWGRRGTRRSTA